ncbi:pentatricopeptide repeat-containing protein At3g53170 [Ricinus communis]|uniref:Pentatricopeptide repeat-containing protein, putative n=1 Tax=Ricinus communis TaxID=3988 RepID=B9RVL0_RICCO|nr:pentatricopeptide repeat-containing protein At3g53170 [Ricinus communis]EEF44586.1 pentatricopeptide repeat-containing protein, putative [Ricinus communis]|eukprot:XP_002517779.1 pentatricopeptide repeat-containing protein At3g53170 [Ricinus communis]
MHPHPISYTNLYWSYSISTPPTIHLIKVLKERNFHSDPPILGIHSSNLSSDLIPVGPKRHTKKELSRFLRTDAAIKAIEQKADSSKYNRLWPKAVLEALDDAIKERRWKSALKIFELLRKQHWYEPRCQTYTKLLMMLGKCRQPEEARLLFEVMQTEGLRPTIDVYTALVSAYGESGLLAKAFSTVDEMKSVSDCKPDVYTYSVLINICTKLHRFDLIGRILSEMSYLGVECSTVTFNTIINGYGKAKMFREMENSLTNMIEIGNSVPDLFTFNSVIGAYGNSGRIEKMEKWYNEFQLMGISPDIKTFNILIKSYGKAGMYEKINSVIEFMKKRFFPPTVVTYNIIIETFGRAGDIENMDEYFKTMKHLGMKPNAITYCSLVSAYSKAGLLMKVNSILRQVENSDVVLDTTFFNCIINAYGQAGDVDKMAELFLEMRERECMPDNVTFATMIQAYRGQGMTEAAQALEKMMLAAKGNSGGTWMIEA